MFNPQHMDALGLKFAKVYTVTKQNPPSNIFDSRFKRSPMGAEQSRSATQRKPRRASKGETNVLIPPPPNIKISSVLEIDVVLFLVFAYSSDDSNLKCSCKRFQHISRTLNIFRCIERYDMVTLRKILTQSSPIPICNPTNGRTIFHSAATSGRPDVLEMLLEFYPSSKVFDVQDHSKLTPLHLASIRGSKSMVRSLLENGANPNASDKTGRTPLHFTTFAESKIIADELIHHGADVNMKTKIDGSTAAHYTCMQCFQSAPVMLSLLEASGT